MEIDRVISWIVKLSVSIFCLYLRFASVNQGFKSTASREGLNPLEILFEIDDHALEDVAIALTFLTAEGRRRAGQGMEKRPLNPQKASDIFQYAIGLS